MQTVKMVITGPFAAGKTQFIQSISEIEVVATERRITDETARVSRELDAKALGDMVHELGTALGGGGDSPLAGATSGRSQLGQSVAAQRHSASSNSGHSTLRRRLISAIVSVTAWGGRWSAW